MNMISQYSFSEICDTQDLQKRLLIFFSIHNHFFRIISMNGRIVFCTCTTVFSGERISFIERESYDIILFHDHISVSLLIVFIVFVWDIMLNLLYKQVFIFE